MKVVITTDSFLPRWDGVARFLSLLIPVLKKNAQVVVFAPKFEGRPIDLGVNVIRFPLVKIRFGDIYFSSPDKGKMAEHIKTADIVFNQTIGPIGMAGIKLAKKYKKPVVSFIHSIEWDLAKGAVKHGKWFVKRAVRLIAKRLYNRCSLLVCPSSQVADILSANGIRAKKEIVTLGVQTSMFVPPQSKPAAKAKVGILPTRLVVGYVGRLAREKDLGTLYHAFIKIKRRFPKMVLLLVGGGSSDEIPKDSNVILAGPQNDVVKYLQSMDVFVLPSLTETSSLATMEAMSCAVPVITTPVGSIPEYVRDGKTGFIFSRRDVNELEKKLVDLLSSASLRKKIGAAGRSVMQKSYSWDKSAEKLAELLRFQADNFR
jgi:phosphatidylinositol alpha 1,6-mannosyltransferase